MGNTLVRQTRNFGDLGLQVLNAATDFHIGEISKDNLLEVSVFKLHFCGLALRRRLLDKKFDLMVNKGDHVCVVSNDFTDSCKHFSFCHSNDFLSECDFFARFRFFPLTLYIHYSIYLEICQDLFLYSLYIWVNHPEQPYSSLNLTYILYIKF